MSTSKRKKGYKMILENNTTRVWQYPCIIIPLHCILVLSHPYEIVVRNNINVFVIKRRIRSELPIWVYFHGPRDCHGKKEQRSGPLPEGSIVDHKRYSLTLGQQRLRKDLLDRHVILLAPSSGDPTYSTDPQEGKKRKEDQIESKRVRTGNRDEVTHLGSR
jgi:hypothetical protein